MEPTVPDGRTAWIAGATGLVGSALLRRLLADAAFSRVVAAGRRAPDVAHPRLFAATVDLARPATLDAIEQAPAVAFCCLGTTIKKAGSQQAFRAVDLGAVVAFARAARARGARTFLHVTALGADPRSRVFYNRVKGEAEEAVAAVGFESVYALRPSILAGDRRERRTGERLGLVVAGALAPLLGKYRPTAAEDVAAAMVAIAKAPQPGAHVVSAEEIPRLAR